MGLVMVVSGEDCFNGMGWFDSGNFLVQPAIGKDEAIVIDAKLVEDGRIQIPDMDWITGYVPAVFVGFSICDTSLDPTSGHPDREGSPVVVSSRSRAVQSSLLVDGPTKLSAPDYQCFIQ